MASDPRDEVWEARADRAYSDFTARPVRTAAKWFFGAVAVIIALSLIFGMISWIGSWGGEAKRVLSPQNVRDQNTAIIDDYESMDAAAANACQARTAAKENGDPTLVEDPALAYSATYRRIRVDYNRRMANLYEAQAVRRVPVPSNLRSYPQVAPTLEQKLAELCPS
jgi:hypothetical protein